MPSAVSPRKAKLDGEQDMAGDTVGAYVVVHKALAYVRAGVGDGWPPTCAPVNELLT